MQVILTIVHLIISVVLIGLIMLQSEGSGLSATFGGSMSSYHSKRGMEKIVFSSTIVLTVLFFLTSLINFLAF